MNFLEELLSEWYEYYYDCFIKKNISFGEGKNTEEIDILAYNPEKGIVYHIETINFVKSKKKQKEEILKKFENAEKYYKKILNLPEYKIEKIVVVDDVKRVDNVLEELFTKNIKVVAVEEIITDICAELLSQKNSYCLVPEKYSLIRTVYYAIEIIFKELNEKFCNTGR